MLQVLQYQKSGEIVVEELPDPQCPENGILVQTQYSLISAGTERASVEKAQSSLIERIKKQPDDVKMVFDFIKKEGIVSTFNRVQAKLDSYKSLGYSASGIVIESGCKEFSPGDRVACAGAGYANHAELITIPKNLAVKIPDNVDMQDAAYTTLGSIAMQGIRQTEPKIGETITVIGLGLIGLLTVQMLKANGCRVIGLDINSELFEKAKNCGSDLILPSKSESVDSIKAFTRGMLCDSVIITAATSSNQPLELAFDICRKKGKVIIVGAVGMDIKRGPFYTKEIDLKISCSYGPGRYDSSYEELGNDYPYSHVRWTENRNMQAILDLISLNKLDVKLLTTHTFNLNDASKAYDIITGKTQEKYLGILLKYNEVQTNKKPRVTIKETINSSDITAGFIGLGSFAQNHLIPHIKKSGIALAGVANQTAPSSKSAAEKNGFAYFAANPNEIINDSKTNLIFCASRHDSHADIVTNALKSGKAVFVEKPLAINENELQNIITAANSDTPKLMVGFNRRFSKSFTTINDFFAKRTYPLTMIYRINAGFIPKDSWVQQPQQGGRIIGEVCHFIDTMSFLAKALPVKVFAESISSDASNLMIDRDNVSITVKFADGSVGTVIYTASGDSSLDKEYFEAHCERSSAIMNNFERVDLFKSGTKNSLKMDGTKGINNEVAEFIDAVKTGKKMPINFSEIITVTRATFASIESLETGKAIQISKD
jgi:polar amino acid transport system substrate-binding protein